MLILTAIVLINLPLAALGAPEALLRAVGLLLPTAYHALLIGRWGRTAGKRLAGIAVVRADLSAVGYGRALARTAGYLLSAFTVFTGFAMAALSPQGRALHDYVAGTRVVLRGNVPPWRRNAILVLGVLGPAACLVLLLFSPASRLARQAQDPGALDEEASRVRLAALRLALFQAVRESEEGRPAPTLSALVPDFLKVLPPLDTGVHPEASQEEPYPPEVCSAGEDGIELDASKLKDTGRWGYIGAGEKPCLGTVFVDCTHLDFDGKSWYGY